MKGLYALSNETFCSKYLTLPKQVAENIWTDLWNRWYIVENFVSFPSSGDCESIQNSG